MTQFVLESRIFQLSETALAMFACKVTELTSVSISGSDMISLFLKTSHNVAGVKTLADLKGYDVRVMLLLHISQFFRHSFYHIQEILLHK